MSKLDTISLRCGKWQAQVAAGVGMNTMSLICDGIPVLRTPPSVGVLKQNPCVYGTPLLLPPNRTAGGTFTFDGRTQQLPVNEPAFGNHLHGFLHSQPFELTDVAENRICGVFENQGAIFPYYYRIEVICTLTEEGYQQEFLITNTGDCDMPVTFGLHTVFTNPEEIRVPIDCRWEVNDCYIPTGKLEELSEEARSYRDGMVPEGRLVRGFYTSCGCEARIGKFVYRVSPNFNQWVLWNGDGASGFCAVEPMCGAVNALNSGEGLLRLKAGETVRFVTMILQAETIG